MNALVCLLDPPFSELTYALAPEFPLSFWKEGLRVAVPLGHGPLRTGVISGLTDKAPEGVRLKAICWPLETEPLLPGHLLSLVRDLATRACQTPGSSISLLLPFLNKTSASLRRMEPPRGEARTIQLKNLAKANAELRQTLATELLAGKSRMLPPRTDAARTERCVLTCDPPWPIRPHAEIQRKALEYLAFHGATNLRTLIRELGPRGAAIVDSLATAGCLRVEVDEPDEAEERMNDALMAPREAAFELSPAQKEAVASIGEAIRAGRPAHRLLYGVTGSGKTAVYLECAKLALSLGRSVLLLAPEVALAHKLRRDTEQALPGTDVIFYHGYQGQSRRESTFRALAARKTPCVVVGTRSSLFLPLPALGLVLLDEEHDASYKQEDHVPYHAKEVAWFRASRENAVLVLGTATPDMKTWHAALASSLPVLRLPSRVSGRALPPVELVDISANRGLSPKDTQLAPQVIETLDATIKRGEQAVILLNRRGFAPLIYCTDCRKTLTCPNCAVGLAYHRNEGRLLCHYCGHSVPFPAPCPTCHSMNYLPVGEGTERLAEYLEVQLGCRVLRLDRDTARRAGAMEEILQAFAKNEAGILVGTQMLSKGHHFPGVTLAVVADGDLGLSLPDYRAAERTFQLLVQSSGRAGRGEKPGRVLIQTRDTSHYCWRFVRDADYEGFYAEEITRRQRFGYPPFVRLSMLRFSFERESIDGSDAMREISIHLRKLAQAHNIRLLGPVPSPISCINNRLRWQCIIKAQDWQSARALYQAACQHPLASKLRIRLDPDPVSML